MKLAIPQAREACMPDWRGACSFAQRGVMRGGGRGAGGEEFRRSAGAASGALWKGPRPEGGKVPQIRHLPSITPVVRCQPSTTRDRPLVGFGARNEFDQHPRSG